MRLLARQFPGCREGRALNSFVLRPEITFTIACPDIFFVFSPSTRGPLVSVHRSRGQSREGKVPRPASLPHLISAAVDRLQPTVHESACSPADANWLRDFPRSELGRCSARQQKLLAHVNPAIYSATERRSSYPWISCPGEAVTSICA